MQIIKADLAHLEILIPLFDAYRVFYQQASNELRAKTFLQARLSNKDSIIFLALDDEGHGVGFTQLYPSFTSIGMTRIYVLNDLYVKPEYRKQSVGRALMNAAKEFAIEQGAAKLMLSTAYDNFNAQKLYQALGYQRDEKFMVYFLSL